MASTVEQQPAQSEAEYAAREKRAVKKEELVNLTSGAKEKLDKTIAGMKGAGHIMTHGFSKGAREEAKTKTIEEKNEVGNKQASIRVAAQQQLQQEKAIAGGATHPEGDSPMTAGQGQIPAGPPPARLTEESEESPSSSSSDNSAHARAQIRPDSEDYRSG